MGTAQPEENQAQHAAQTDPKVLLDRFYDAEVRYMNAGGAAAGADFSEIAACMHDDVVFRHGPSVPYPGDWTGAEGVERLFNAMSETWDYLNFEEFEHFYNPTGVAIKLKGALRSRATGVTVSGEAGQFVIVNDGLIKEWITFFLDPVALTEACSDSSYPAPTEEAS